MASAKFELGPISFETKGAEIPVLGLALGNRSTERNVSVKPRPPLFLNGIFIRVRVTIATDRAFCIENSYRPTRRHCSTYASRARHVGNDTREVRRGKTRMRKHLASWKAE